MTDDEAPVAVVAAVIERRGRYLLAQRPVHKAHGGRWEFPGGKVETGESLSIALARELAEELVLHRVAVGEVLLSLDDPSRSLRLHFLAVASDAAPIAIEHSALGWYLPQEARGLDLAPLDRAFLETHEFTDGGLGT